MKRHAKAPSTGSTSATTTAFGRLSAVLLGALCAALLLSASASAAGYKLQSSFSATTPEFSAVDEETGAIYTVDPSGEGMIDKFDAAGTPTNFSLAHPTSQLSGAETANGKFEFKTAGEGFINQIAVDNSGGASQGNIYVNDETTEALYAFDSSGELLWEVDSAEAPSGSWDVCGTAVDSSGNVFTTSYGDHAAYRYSAAGVYSGTSIDLSDNTSNPACSIAFDTTANLFAGHYLGTATKYVAPGYTLPSTTIDSNNAAAAFPLATDPAGNVYVDEGAQVAAFDSSGNPLEGTPFGSGEIGAASDGIALNGKTGHLYVSDAEAGKVHLFAIEPALKVLANPGSGSGTVTADSGGISCPGTCEANYEYGKEVQLTATPGAHSSLTGWAVSGGPAGTCTTTTNPCTLTLEADTSVTAEFDAVQHEVTVTKAGTGTGSVTSAPSGINCGATCSAEYTEETKIELTATPGAHSTFDGWSGACTNKEGKCVIAAAEFTSDKALTATFAQVKPTVAGETAAGLAQHAATLSGTVNPNGDATTCQFEYGTTTSYGTTVPCTTGPGAGTSPVAVSIPALGSLSPNTTYHYRIDATNSGGTSEGGDHTFATLADTCATNSALCPPPVVTPPVVNPPTNPAAYKVCVKKAGKAYGKALKKAHTAPQKKAAQTRKKKAIKKCASRFL